MTLRIAVAYAAEGIRRGGTATTLGAGGLFIATDEPLDEGVALHVRFRLPGGASEHRLRGRVVWNHRPQDAPAGRCGMGIAFIDPAPRLAAELEAIAREAEAGDDARSRSD